MDRCAQHLRPGDAAPYGLAGSRNAGVNRRACGAVADGCARELIQVSKRSPRHAQSRRVLPELELRRRRNLRNRNRLRVDRNHRRSMRKRRMGGKMRWLDAPTPIRIAPDRRECRDVIHAVPISASAGHPSPTHVVAICPGTGVIRRPPPGIRRNP